MPIVKDDDLPAKLLKVVQHRISAPLRPWSEAILAELGVIDRFWPRLWWSLGGIAALAQTSFRHAIKNNAGEERRLDVSLIAGYQFLSSAILIGLLTWQLPRVTESWKYALPALTLSYAIALLPAFFGLGLVLRDEAARLGTVMFTIARLLLNIEYIRGGYMAHPGVAEVRLAVDVSIILLLSRQAVRHYFALSPLSLHLKDETFRQD